MRLQKRDVSVAALSLTILFGMSCAKAPVQTKFATPEAAAAALLQAFKNNDTAKIEGMFGREVIRDLASGDPASDRRDRELIGLAMGQSWKWVPVNAQTSELIIGDDQWPFPAPLVKTGTEWQFDGNAAKGEILARRIGRNELDVIGLCHALVSMQREYARQSHDGKPAGLFAQRLRSSPGRQDGLYWPRIPGKMRSPLGDLVAQAAAEGYDENKQTSAPFWGYQFRVLTAQGDAAPGGRRSYIDKGDMSGGFAILAFPAKYATSGVMTFAVNQNNVVYEKDLGSQTATLALRITEYNPDESWYEVQLPESDVPLRTAPLRSGTGGK
ncbi:MAG TPA: DUF2950 family protein [Bryobacteraceae bacterium]|nr:DUF2950 family protein [Bryobacteraceae bacterium]